MYVLLHNLNRGDNQHQAPDEIKSINICNINYCQITKIQSAIITVVKITAVYESIGHPQQESIRHNEVISCTVMLTACPTFATIGFEKLN
jgi:hypothetical protein